MNGENDHIFHASALDGAPAERYPQPSHAWRLLAANAWLMAAFVGMSLIAIALTLLFQGDYGDRFGELLALGLGGAVLTPVACRNVARVLQ
jgi:hypothetical protein